MRDEPHTPTRHQLDHAVPTVIHHPEEDMPLLARWVQHAMENPLRFWGMIAGVVVVVIGLAALSSGLSMGRSTSDKAWIQLETAKTPTERIAIAREYPGTQAEQWALLQAASEYYLQGFNDLPANRDVALPALKKALELFEEVVRIAPQDSPQARAAALGVARTFEARNELEKATTQYKKVASTWKGTPEASEAERLIKALSRPENVAFYKELYASSNKPSEVTLPPGGRGTMTLPPGHPSLDGSPTTPSPLSNFPSPLMLPPPPPAPKAETPKEKEAAKSTPEPALPPDVFAPEKPKD